MIALLVACALGPSSASANLLTNGDFETGTRGFTSDYKLSAQLSEDGMYAVSRNPHLVHSGGLSMGDHTTGSGSMLVVNGSTRPDTTVWQETVKVSPDQTYVFSGWTAAWTVLPGDVVPVDPNPAQILVFINGKAIGPAYTVKARSGTWSKFSFTWKSTTKTQAVIKIVDSTFEAFGNDFALDDLSFSTAHQIVAKG